jgi:hypothetical protein
LSQPKSHLISIGWLFILSKRSFYSDPIQGSLLGEIPNWIALDLSHPLAGRIPNRMKKKKRPIVLLVFSE